MTLLNMLLFFVWLASCEFVVSRYKTICSHTNAVVCQGEHLESPRSIQRGAGHSSETVAVQKQLLKN
jgi:hypothetical protein